MQKVAQDVNALPFVSYNTEAMKMTWDESTSTWVINIRHLVTGVEKTIRADFVVAGTGPLALPKMPQNIPGISSFKGRQAHTAQYDSSLIVDGKKVVLVGNGSSLDPNFHTFVTAPHLSHSRSLRPPSRRSNHPQSRASHHLPTFAVLGRPPRRRSPLQHNPLDAP